MLLERAERSAETISALLRLVILLTLAAAAGSSEASITGGPGLVLAAYGISTALGLGLAWRRLFHAAIPYLFVIFDVVLVSLLVLMLARSMDMDPRFAFALHASGFGFLILAHAAMRHRPSLILLAAGLLLAVLQGGGLLLRDEAAQGTASMAEHVGAGTLTFVLPATLVVLVAAVLFVTSRRTRALLLEGIDRAGRAARLSRYFSPSVVQSLAEGSGAASLAGHRQQAAILFIDMHGFTAHGETMPPEELGRFLSELRTRLTRPIFRRGGAVDKFIGDGVMAVFGTPAPRPDDARRALTCAFEILDAMAVWNRERQSAGLAAISVAIGAHHGEVFAGAIGDDQQLEYTVVGDTVNVAARLERLTRQEGSPLIVSAALLDAAGVSPRSMEWRGLPKQALRGHREPLDVYALAMSPPQAGDRGRRELVLPAHV